MATVKILSVPGEQLSHDGGDPVLAAPKEEMDVTVQERPGVDGAFSFDGILAEPLKEQGPVPVIPEDVGFIDPPNHDVVQGAGHVQSGSTRHGVPLSDFQRAVKRNAT
jgi:hypothetical protein